MRTYLTLTMASAVGLFSLPGVAAEPLDSVVSDEIRFAQNTGAADRTLGNSSMGLGEGIRRLPESPESARDEDEKPRAGGYDESGHGDNDTDMEHRPRRTLGDREDD